MIQVRLTELPANRSPSPAARTEPIASAAPAITPRSPTPPRGRTSKSSHRDRLRATGVDRELIQVEVDGESKPAGMCSCARLTA